ncbi:MAG: hypothetical protein J6W52_05585 [Bacteroidaceae bacterium]|nr:hypothetical protein [Bacteroidaceae bacterium]
MEEGEKRWCILRHSDADLIGEIFSGKRKVYNSDEDDPYPLPPFEHFIPFNDLKQRSREQNASDKDDYKPYDAMLDERALRNDLHHFIFIQVTKEQILSILDAPWVKVLRNRLYVYRDENGTPIEISNTEVERFKTVIKRYDFQILNGEPSDDVREGDQVMVVSGPMAGSEGKVMQIRERDGQILLTIEFSMFQDKMCIAVPGINIADVRLSAPETQQLLQDPLIGHFEDELIELLCHLHGKKGTKALNKEDYRQLKYLYQYADIIFEDNEENRVKFSALMLICVYLMNDKEEMAKRTQEVKSILNSQFSILNEELACYLMTALFIVTHNPEYRKAAKAWRQSHPDCSLAIRRFQSIAKQIRC